MTATLVEAGFPVDSIHGDKAQSSRVQAVTNLSCGQLKVLATTDAMPKDVEILGVTMVILFDMCGIDEYVYRIGLPGRTAQGARVGGQLLTLYEHDTKWPDVAGALVDQLEQHGQAVPGKLRSLAATSRRAVGGNAWTGRAAVPPEPEMVQLTVTA